MRAAGISIGAGDAVLMALGVVLVVAGLRGPPGLARLMRHRRVAGSRWQGALVALALIYSMAMPSLGVVLIVVGAG